jgi:hypothetical protein
MVKNPPIPGVQSWNALQALLKSIGRELALGWKFLGVPLVGIAGFDWVLFRYTERYQ